MIRILLAGFYLVFSAQLHASSKLVFSTAEESAIQDISVQVLREAYAEIGYELEIVRTSNARSLMLANQGRTDGEVSRVQGIENEFSNLVRVPVTVNILDVRAFSKSPAVKVVNWEGLKGYRLICVKGSKLVERNLASREIECYFVTQFAQAINMLNAGRGDIAILPEVNGLQAIKHLNLPGIGMTESSLHRAGLYHYLNIKHQGLVAKINSALQRMQARGRIKQIRAEYLKSQQVGGEPPRSAGVASPTP